MKSMITSLLALAVSTSAFAADNICGPLLNQAQTQSMGLEPLQVHSEKFFSSIFDRRPSTSIEQIDVQMDISGRLVISANGEELKYINSADFQTEILNPEQNIPYVSKQFGQPEGFLLTNVKDGNQILILTKQNGLAKTWSFNWWVKPTVQNSMRVPVGIGDRTYSWGVIDIPGGWAQVVDFAHIPRMNFQVKTIR